MAARVGDRVAARLVAESEQDSWNSANRRAAVDRLCAQELQAEVASALAAGLPSPRREITDLVIRSVADRLLGLGGLQPYLELPGVEDIDILGHDVVFVKYAGKRRERGPWPVAASDAELVDLVRTIAARSGIEERRFDRGSPILSIGLPDGSRMTAVMAVNRRPSVTIRRHLHRDIDLEEMVRLRTIDEGLRDFLAAAVQARCNVLIAGGMGAGKTTLLRALATEIDPCEKLVTIEDAFELGLDADTDRHLVVDALQAREANAEGAGRISAADLVRAGLRLSAGRVIVGEVRGDETLPMLLAMSQGNDGSLSTVHAESADAAFDRLITYALLAPERAPAEAVARLAAHGIDLVLHVAELADGRRVVREVAEVTGSDADRVVTNRLYEPGLDGAAVRATPPSTALTERLATVEYDPFAARTYERQSW
ncbi:CpaF family protein [Catenulispora pinisilvae]|uniref:CpaF family protein n=1 Tax=Catenulispora pinisilvae TaxID=2705253 RepID=UPI00189205A4|nr:ATPase, T2SS/T4P/T4SS family [Catenulispora pinisilvae]